MLHRVKRIGLLLKIEGKNWSTHVETTVVPFRGKTVILTGATGCLLKVA